MIRSAPLSLVGLLLLLLLSPAPSESVDPELQDLTNRNADFAARVYCAVAKRTDGNVFLSPFTLSIALTALLSAAEGPTRDDLLLGLTLNGLDPQTLPDLFQTLRSTVLQGSDTTSLRQGVAVFPSETYPMSSSYLDLVQTKFGGNAQLLSYAEPHQAIDTVNHWAQEQTGDQVRELVSSLDQQTQLLVATAAFYQTQFSPAFNASSTQDERFYVDRYHVIVVPMMFRADKYFLAYDRSVKAGVLKLPMADGAAMLVVLPDEDVDIITVEEQVTADKIRGWIHQLKKTKLEVQLPRFLLEGSYALKDVLQTLEITQVFLDDADLSNMGGAKGPRLTEVYHKSVIAVEESSDDITAGGGAATFSTPPPRLTINRPFIFVIYHQSSGSLLSMGRVANPSLK
ncbi:serpin peptidase inhibitor, clade A (alpha-1 antiproteinase, antitrypsin), member 10a [Brachyistius frenatus]|uniref:serpin peptidase inhibitor, clade A (alpha-1 antiproteinase, antitrypsin), member 10a n=1 Tax=Brachyistius frenatus TaxID=100188 RepID=UPI0037E7447B